MNVVAVLVHAFPLLALMFALHACTKITVFLFPHASIDAPHRNVRLVQATYSTLKPIPDHFTHSEYNGDLKNATPRLCRHAILPSTAVSH